MKTKIQNKNKMNNLEIRNIQTELRSIEPESRKVSGLAIPVGTRSELLYGEFYETILPQALDDVINRFDVKLYLNHDPAQGTYARSKYGEGSLHLFVTERGLEFETELPNTVYGDALLEGIRRNDYDAMSFAFAPDDEEWSENEDGTYERSIRHFALLDECSILSCAPAYSATNVSIRSLDEFKEKRQKEKEEAEKEILAKLDNKLNEINEQIKDIEL